MRLFTKAYYFESLEFSNGFEGMTFAELNDDPDDGWYLGGSGTQDWTNWDNGSFRRTGSKALIRTSSNDSENLYRSITAGKQFQVEAWFYWDNQDDLTQSVTAGFQIDDGSDTDDHASFGSSKPSNYVAFEIEFIHDAATSDYHKLKIHSGFGGTYVTEKTITKSGWTTAGVWIGVKLVFTPDNFTLYTDRGDTGIWDLEVSQAFSNTGTLANMSNLRIFCEYYSGTGEGSIIDDVTVWELQTQSAQEITVQGPINCSKKIGGGGSLLAKIHDRLLANHSTNKEYIMNLVEVKKDDLSQVVWEGYLFENITNSFNVQLIGVDGLTYLAKVSANYNAILAEGEVSAVGADYIDDNNASFTDDVLNKFAIFSDKDGPSVETVNPNANSEWQTSGGVSYTPTFVEGDYTKLAIDSTARADRWNAEAEPGNYYQLYLEFDVPNEDNCTQLDILVKCFFNPFYQYTQHANGTKPSIYIYDDNGAAWEKLGDVEISPDTEAYYETTFTKTTNLSNYFDASHVMKMKIQSGTPTDGSGNTVTRKIHCAYVEVKNTYSAVFAAQDEVYEIDSRTSTRLTFTGQSPQSDGVAQGDRYKVGDYLHNILSNLWKTSELELDVDSTTIVDAADWSNAYIRDVIMLYAQMMDRKVWHRYGWTIACKSSYESSGITITENDIVEYYNPQAQSWGYRRSAYELIRSIILLGDGVRVTKSDTPDYSTDRALIVSDRRLSTVATATSTATNILNDLKSLKEYFYFRLDYDNGTDYSALDVGKTLTVNIASGTISLTDILIVEMAFTQSPGSHLYCDVVCEII